MGVSIAHSFAQVISSWDGPVVVGLADGSTHEVLAGTELVLSELGALASWPGAEPSGVFWPWSAVVYIRQAAPAPPPDSPPAGAPPQSSQASPPAGDPARMAGPQPPAPPAAPPRPAPARDT